MAAKRADTCYSCHYWEGQGFRQRGPKGVCHRYPPVVTPRHNDGRFPVTMSSDWCGEWRRTQVEPIASDGPSIYDDFVE